MNLLKMSFSGGIMVLVIIILRCILLKRLPKKVFLVLWGIALIRLLVPYSVPSVLSIYSVINKNLIEVNEVAYTADNFIPMQTEAQVFENTYNHTSKNIDGVSPVVILWIIGMAVMFILFALSYKRCFWDINTSLPVNNDFIINWLKEHRLIRKYTVRVSGNIASPLAFSIFKPIILIPKATEYFDEKQLNFILLHEYLHIRHLDTITKLVMAAALCIHWFNPVVWAMFILYNRDIELACDESVVLYSGENNKSEYANMLINMAEKMSGFPPLQSNFSANSIEERIEAIMKIKKLKFKSFTLSLAVMTALTTVFATSASAENKSETILFEESVINAGSLSAEQEKAKSYEDYLKEYEKFGISDKNGVLYYYEKPVRWFLDGYEYNDEDGSYQMSRYENYYEFGTVDVHTVRNDIKNEDGSTTLFGEIIDIVSYSQEEFDNREFNVADLTEVAYEDSAASEFDDSAVSQISEDIISTKEDYPEFGIVDVHTNTVRNDIYSQEEFDDPAVSQTSEDIISTEEGDSITTSLSEDVLVFQESGATTYTYGESAGGKTIEDILSEFSTYGVTYKKINGSQGNIYFNGKLIKAFVDEKPDGSIFVTQSKDGGTGVIYTVYDEQGKCLYVMSKPIKKQN